MIQVIDGEIRQYKLPRVGTLKDGRMVDNYHLLDKEILYNEGWLDEIDEKPTYNKKTHYIRYDKHIHDLVGKKSIKKYKVFEIPREESPINYKEEILELKKIVSILIGDENIE